jgi:hypothetical protein
MRAMQRHQAFRYELRPTGHQEALLRRFVHNEHAVLKETLGSVSPDGLWIEPRWRSEAGTHRGAISEQDEPGDAR